VTIVKSAQGTVNADPANWVTIWSAEAGLTVAEGWFEEIRASDGAPAVSDYGHIVTNADGVVIKESGHHPANAYAWCLVLG